MDITCIGPAIIDVLACPTSPAVFTSGSEPAETIKLSYGGDACNEAVALARMGCAVNLVSLLGQDEAGDMVFSYLARNHVDTSAITRSHDLPTGINLVLVDKDGERCFITNPGGSLRHLNEEMIRSHVDDMADIVSFASFFISFDLSVDALCRTFKAIKQKNGRILAVDFTRPKNGETIETLRPLLPDIDILFANAEEACMLCGSSDPAICAETFVRSGVTCAVVKTGKHGCVLAASSFCLSVPAFSPVECVDTTGAGDCFAAGFLYALKQGMSYPDCARFGCAAASCCVEMVGATEGIRAIEAIRSRFEHLCQVSNLQ